MSSPTSRPSWRGPRPRSSRTASPATSKGSPGWPTPGTTSTVCSASPRRRRASSWRRRCARCSATASTSWGSAPRIGCDVSLLVVGSIALDSVYTPFGETADAPGGSAVFFSAAGAILHPVQVVGVVGTDYPLAALKALEARGVDLSGDWNIYRAARWVLEHGPKMTVIKQGEHGALLVNHDTTFKVPAYPLQEVFDPTGAGDAFAGGFMAYLAASDDVTAPNLRRAMVYGAALGSFAVEAFGVQGLEHVTRADVRARVRAFKELVHFDIDEAGAG